MIVETYPSAIREATTAMRWYRRRGGELVALRFDAALQAAIARVLNSPKGGSPHPFNTRVVLLKKFSIQVDLYSDNNASLRGRDRSQIAVASDAVGSKLDFAHRHLESVLHSLFLNRLIFELIVFKSLQTLAALSILPGFHGFDEYCLKNWNQLG